MKNFLTILIFLCALAARADYTPTNAVKGSALPSAGALAGTDKILVIQSSTTKIATVDQVVAAPSGSIIAASNWLSLNIASNAATCVVASNWLSLNIQSNAATVTVFSNAVAATNVLNAAASTALSNGLIQRLAGSNYLTAAQVASSNFQSGAQVTATVNGALAAAGALTNGGAASFGTITTTNLNLASQLGSYTISADTNIFVDFAAGSFQNVWLNFSGGAGTYNLTFTPSNVLSGQQINLVINALGRAERVASGTVAGWKTAGTLALNGGANVPSANVVNLNWLVVGTNILFSGSYAP